MQIKGRVILKKGKEQSVLRRHPWLFSGAVARIEGKPGPGDTVEVRSDAGAFLALAAYSPHSQIRARIWCWEECEVDAAFSRAGSKMRAQPAKCSAST